ncbi:MAG: TonB-dependent receptor [Porticoccaceae bacterium]
MKNSKQSSIFHQAPRRKSLFLAIAASLGAASAAVAQDAPPAERGGADERTMIFSPVRVIGNLEDPQATTGSAYTLTERELEKFEYTNVTNILRNVPGVYVREEDGLGTYPRIGIRASSAGRSDRVTILEDGIPAAMSIYANTSAYFFPPVGRIQGIEVLKGPEILLHGPHTTAGVVNLLSTEIPEEAGGMLNVELSEFNTRKIHAYYGATYGQFGFLLETYQANSDGFHNIDRSSHTAGNDINDYVGKVRWTSDPGAAYKQQLDLKIQYNEETADVSYLGLTEADFNSNSNRRYGLSELERMDRGRKAVSLRHQFHFDDSTKLTSTAYWGDTYRYYNRLNQINGISLGGITDIINNNLAGTTPHNSAALLNGILQGTADTTHANGVRYGHNHQNFEARGVQFELNKQFSTGAIEHDLVVGVRRHEDITGNAVKGISNSIYNQVNGSLVYISTAAATPSEGEAKATSVWIADYITVGSWTLMPIIRYEDIETRGNVASGVSHTAANSNSLDQTTLGFGANYALDGNWTLLAGVHEGFAPPGNGVGRGTEGEESLNFEAGVRYRSTDGSFGVDAIAFYSDYDTTVRQCLFANPCVNPVPGGAPIVDGSTQQTGAKEVAGLELGIFADLYDNGSIKVPLRLSYTYTDGEYNGASDLPTGVQSGDVLEYMPENIAALQIGVESVHNWRAYAAFNYTDGSYTTNTAGRSGVDNTYLTTEDLFTVDLNMTFSLSEDTEVYAKVDNLFDEQSITHRGADGARGNAPRWAGVGFRIRY